jgi:phage terminase large subunit-like protein
MWHETTKYKKKTDNYNEIFKQIQGELGDKEAKITLIKFLRQNLYITTYLLTGVKLSPYQEITLKGLFNRNFSMCVWGRGCGKSFIASIYCVLQCIFEPNTKILIAGPTFRTARAIFNNIEKMSETKGAELLLQAFGAKSKRNDLYEWDINGGSIRAIPLSGEKIRGFRANILVLDEFMLLPEEIIKNVLMPFLVAPQDMKRRIDIREMEDLLIKKGKMKEEERMVFVNNSKMIALSSASYTF